MSANYQANNNCYAYSTNIASNSFAQPGRLHGLQLNKIEPNWTKEDVKKGAIKDGLVYVGGEELSPNELWQHVPDYAPYKGHFVALLISDRKDFHLKMKEEDHIIEWEWEEWPGDYHWVRCDNYDTDSWSQKDGGDQVTNFDFAGAPITDPRSACWTVNQGPMFQYYDKNGNPLGNPDSIVVEYKFYCWMYVPNGKVHII